MPKITRDTLTEFVTDFQHTHSHPPTVRNVADHFECSAGFAGRITRELLDDPDFFRAGSRNRVQASRADDAGRAFQFVCDYISANDWAPSQREVADAIGCSIQHANATLNRLVADGLIEKGPHPRQIRVVASAMKSPEYRL